MPFENVNELFGGDSADIHIAVGKGGYLYSRHLAEIAVVKAYHGNVLGNSLSMGSEKLDQHICYLVIVANHGSSVTD